MNVYIITKQSFPDGMAGTNRIKCYAKAIASQGVSCKILIYQRTEIYGKPKRNYLGQGDFDGIKYKYIGGTALRSKYPIVRKFNDIKDKINTCIYLNKFLKKDDVVLGYAGFDVKFINCIIRIIHSKKAFFIRELCELPYGTGKETSKTIRKRAYSLRTQFPLCDGVIAISDALVELARQHVSNKCHIIKVPILVDLEQYYLKDRSSEAEIPYIFHAGTLYEQKDGILGVFEAFGKVTKKTSKKIHFICTGSPQKSPQYQEILNIINQYQINDKITFTGYIFSEQIREYLSKASLVIINKHPNQQNTYGFSTKLGEYLAAGKPVIITKVGEAMNWLKDGESAYIIEPNNTDLLVKAIVDAFLDDEKRKTIGKNGQDVCRDSFDYKKYGKPLVQFFSKIIHQKY